MSGSYELRLAHIRALGDAAVGMLLADPTLSARGAAAAVGISESSVYTAWRRTYPDRPPRGRGRITAQMRALQTEPFRTLCDVMLDHVPSRDSAGAGEIFAAVRRDYGEVGERRLFRALRRLLDTKQIERVGAICMSTYRRMP